MSSEVGLLFSTPAMDALARHTPIPQSVRSLMAESAARLVDSDMVIGDPWTGFIAVEESRVKTQLPDMRVLEPLRALVEQVKSEGFGPHAVRFFSLLGAVMVDLSGTDAQKQDLASWVGDGYTGTFCMTDRGGPLASQWNSVAMTGSPAVLKVDKIWAMNACEADFAIVIVRRGDSMVLAPILVPPQIYKAAEKKPSGLPFLDDRLPLGDIKFQADLDPEAILSKGGPISSKIFLALARPWLIQALCGHIEWLKKNGRITLRDQDLERIAFLREASINQAALGIFDRFTEDQAMALKWVANEVWSDLVVRGAAQSLNDQRDLIAFTKMEGSSYRCFFEIYRRNKRYRHANA
jgi:hypothetical protein